MRISPNRPGVKPVSVARLVLWGLPWSDYGRTGELQIINLAEGFLEETAIEGESPVSERFDDSLDRFPSTTGHEKPCGNPGGPSPKAKYYSATDSEPVP